MNFFFLMIKFVLIIKLHASAGHEFIRGGRQLGTQVEWDSGQRADPGNRAAEPKLVETLFHHPAVLPALLA